MRTSLFKMIVIGLLAALAGSFLEGTQPAGAEQSPERQLFHLMERGHRVNLVGTQSIEVRLGKRRARGSARVARLNGCTRTEILSPDRLKGMVTLEQGTRRLVRRPGDTRWQARQGNPPSPSHFRKILKNYVVQVAGTASVAGRGATILLIQSRATDKPARKFWVDLQTGVVLRTELFNWSGQLVYVTEFQQIDYTPNLDEKDFQVPCLGPGKGARTPPPVADAEALPTPSYLPAGYELIGQPRWMQTRLGRAAHLRYTDGLNGISVFVRKLKPGETSRAPGGPMPVMDQPFSSIIQYVKGDYRVTLIGDVSPAELRRIADSIQ